MRRIVIDCRFTASHSGLGRYTREIVSHLVARNAAAYVLLVPSSPLSWLSSTTAETVVTDIPHYSLREQCFLPSLLESTKADLYFSPHFNVPLLCPLPFVVTIHDLILHRFPNHASMLRRNAYRLLFSRAIHRARSIIAISPFVQDELCAFAPSARSKVHVIEEGVSAHFSPQSPSAVAEAKQRYRLPEQYFLYVGNAKEHKNLEFLIRAHQQSATKVPLLLVTHGKEVRSMHFPSQVQVLEHVEENDLPRLYTGAVALVTASQYEGFCLPLVEALACGCPVIAPEISAMPGTVGRARGAQLLPLTEEAFVRAFQHPPARCGPEQLWSWEETARKTEELLLRVPITP